MYLSIWRHHTTSSHTRKSNKTRIIRQIAYSIIGIREHLAYYHQRFVFFLIPCVLPQWMISNFNYNINYHWKVSKNLIINNAVFKITGFNIDDFNDILEGNSCWMPTILSFDIQPWIRFTVLTSGTINQMEKSVLHFILPSVILALKFLFVFTLQV